MAFACELLVSSFDASKFTTDLPLSIVLFRALLMAEIQLLMSSADVA